ncbi:transposase [Streptomyces rapamycinicus]|uniref:Transposase n=2 Tax=Streptomyces rapamycinicus TaxID=1226757 RepID=A0A3L8RFY5_STRRN|nr:transposase [Streptomyces rapamycinicus]RLV78684.1 transposase [Streptomyces rapamycinicus NRRL 5491]
MREFTSLDAATFASWRTFIRIGRFEPTSQVCCVCGVKDGRKPPHVRVWTCGACGTVQGREDVNSM